MRIRYAIKAHLQVLQASRMEKHMMPDGPRPLSGLSLLVVCRQWGLSTNDPGDGEGIFKYPVTCNPFVALANIIMIGYNCDVAVKKLGKTSCAIDSSDGTYNNKYRVVVIGRN